MPPVEANQLPFVGDVSLATGETIYELDGLADRACRADALDTQLFEP